MTEEPIISNEETILTEEFDYKDFCNLDHTLANYILPRLKHFRSLNKGYPGCFESTDEWNEVIDDMIFAFEFYANGAWNIQTFDEEKKTKKFYKRIRKGMKNFAKYFGSLWI